MVETLYTTFKKLILKLTLKTVCKSSPLWTHKRHSISHMYGQDMEYEYILKKSCHAYHTIIRFHWMLVTKPRRFKGNALEFICRWFHCQYDRKRGDMPYCDWQYIITHWGRDKMAPVFQMTFSKHFLEWKCIKIAIKISVKFVPKGPINNIPTLVKIMAWHWPG